MTCYCIAIRKQCKYLRYFYFQINKYNSRGRKSFGSSDHSLPRHHMLPDLWFLNFLVNYQLQQNGPRYYLLFHPSDWISNRTKTKTLFLLMIPIWICQVIRMCFHPSRHPCSQSVNNRLQLTNTPYFVWNYHQQWTSKVCLDLWIGCTTIYKWS